MQILKSGALYFALVFGAGFLLGSVRVLWVLPLLGERTAELLEAPIMLVCIVLAARWVVGRFTLPPTPSMRLGIGLLAVSFMLAAELWVVLWLRGLTIEQYIASRDSVAGTAYILMLGLFAIMPLLVHRSRRHQVGKPSDDRLQNCAEKIRWVAASIDDDEFRSKAARAADDLGPDSIEALASLFHSEHSPPEELRHRFPGLGDWIAARQFAIFEVLYHLREAALPLLRRVAWGEYDWTQGNAIEVLCRLAAEGVDRDQIIAEMRRGFPHLRYEAQLYAVEPLLKLAQSSPALTEVLRELEDIQEYQEAVEELQVSGDGS